MTTIVAPTECRECGSTSLTWAAHSENKSGVQEGRLRTQEVSSVFVLGCDTCSETLKVVGADKVAAVLNAPVEPQKYDDTLLATPDRRDMAAAAYGLKRDAAPPQKYDDTLLPFLALMRAELHANSHKGDREGWLGMTLEQALDEIRHHHDKLIVPVMNHDRAAILEHAADVANCAMMLADITGVLTDGKA